MRFPILVCALSAAATASPAFGAEIEGELAVVSDYRWRGVSLSSEDPSLQIEATASFDNGAWLWGNVNSVSADYGGSEIGLGAGYTRELASVEWTAGVTRYIYAGEEALDYTELALSAAKTIGAVSLSAGAEYAPQQDNYEDDLYLWLGGVIALPHDARFYAQVGRDDGSMAPTPYAVDVTLGAAIMVSAFEFDISYVEVDTVLTGLGVADRASAFMSITKKTASVLVGLFVVLLLGAWAILENAVRPGFERLELQAQESDKARVEARLATLAQDMSARVLDYAGWDETYAFVGGRNNAFVAENFTDDWLGGYNLDLAVFTNDDGDILWSKARGAVGNVGPGLDAANAILRNVRSTRIGAVPVTGVFWSVEGPMMFAAARATRNDGSGEPRGIVVFARRISRDALRAQVQLDVQLISAAQAPPDFAAHLLGLEHINSETWASEHSMHSLIALRDARGKLVGAVLGTRARDITALGVRLIGTTLLLFAIMSALAVAALWVLLRRVVISRIVRLEQHFNAQSNAIEPIEAVTASRDEIGSLTAAYNALVVRLREMAVSERDANLAREAEAAANRMKSDFLANISHELRTPLDAVIGYAELIEEELADLGLATATEDLNRIRAAGRHLLTLITEILDLSKIEAGKMEITPSSFGIEEMLTMVVDTIRPLARQNDNALSVDIEPGMGNAYSDELRLRQSLINILSNACKYTNGGAVVLRARRSEIDGRAFLRFEVKDTGIGMTDEQLAQVFEPFAEADASITRRFGGTGLGLSITRKIIGLLGGGIEATSREGQGSTFVLTLPAIAADLAPNAPDNAASRESAHQAA